MIPQRIKAEIGKQRLPEGEPIWYGLYGAMPWTPRHAADHVKKALGSEALELARDAYNWLAKSRQFSREQLNKAAKALNRAVKKFPDAYLRGLLGGKRTRLSRKRLSELNYELNVPFEEAVASISKVKPFDELSRVLTEAGREPERVRAAIGELERELADMIRARFRAGEYAIENPSRRALLRSESIGAQVFDPRLASALQGSVAVPLFGGKMKLREPERADVKAILGALVRGGTADENVVNQALQGYRLAQGQKVRASPDWEFPYVYGWALRRAEEAAKAAGLPEDVAREEVAQALRHTRELEVIWRGLRGNPAQGQPGMVPEGAASVIAGVPDVGIQAFHMATAPMRAELGAWRPSTEAALEEDVWRRLQRVLGEERVPDAALMTKIFRGEPKLVDVLNELLKEST